MKNLVSSGKRKRAIARANIVQGKGIVKINNIALENFQPKLARLRMQEPLLLAEDAALKVDIHVNVKGGGIASQADAARLAIAKALVGFSKNKSLKDTYLKYDRNLLVADVRRKEPAKPNRHGQARAKVQKSYR